MFNQLSMTQSADPISGAALSKERSPLETSQMARLAASEANPLADNTLDTANNLGILTGKRSLTDFVGESDAIDYYKFDLATADEVSIFFNGLSAGYTADLLSATGSLLQSSTNSGTAWSLTNSGTTGGSITTFLTAGTYAVRITPTTITGNPLYALPGYTLNLQLHNAPNTVTVAAQNTANSQLADYLCTGTNDQTVIEQALADINTRGGGTVLLMAGTYNISDNVDVTYNNITLSGVGWSTVLRLVDNAKLEDAGLLRSAFHTDEENQRIPYFSNQNFQHLSLNGNKSGGASYTNSYANFGTYVDSSFTDIRAHDFPHYGFDPHENSAAGQPTVRLTMSGNLADHNQVDGLTIDNCLDSKFFNNILDDNGRHGINIVTAARNNLVNNNVVTNNGGNGIVVQPGSEIDRTSDLNRLINNVIHSNKLSGILVQLAEGTEISGNTIVNNAQHGIRLRGATGSNLVNNTIDNNGTSLANKYHGIYLDDYSNTSGVYVASTNNLIENNLIRSTPATYRNGIKERSSRSDFNTYRKNKISGTLKAPLSLLGANSVAIENIIRPPA